MPAGVVALPPRPSVDDTVVSAPYAHVAFAPTEQSATNDREVSVTTTVKLEYSDDVKSAETVHVLFLEDPLRAPQPPRSPSLVPSATTDNEASVAALRALLEDVLAERRRAEADAVGAAREVHLRMAELRDVCSRSQLQAVTLGGRLGRATRRLTTQADADGAYVGALVAAGERQRQLDAGLRYMAEDFVRTVDAAFAGWMARLDVLQCRLSTCEVLVAEVVAPAIRALCPRLKANRAAMEAVWPTRGRGLQQYVEARCLALVTEERVALEARRSAAAVDLQAAHNDLQIAAARLQRCQSAAERLATRALKRTH
jgi:hypothetical protein